MKILLCLLFLASVSLGESFEGPAFLASIQSQILKDADFNKTYAKSGCFIRAHWIAKMIHDEGLQPLKVFIQTPNQNEKMKIKLPNGNQTSWVFHVTAGYQDPSGVVWLIDPVLFSHPVKKEVWVQLIKSQNSDLNLSVTMTGPEVYHVNDQENLEFLQYGSVWSERTMNFIKDGMNVLFLWETFEI